VWIKPANVFITKRGLSVEVITLPWSDVNHSPVFDVIAVMAAAGLGVTPRKAGLFFEYCERES